MLMLSIWSGFAVLAAALMAADWYIWDPRYRRLAPVGPNPAKAAGGNGIGFRHAA